MEQKMKSALGKILGNIYLLQSENGKQYNSDAHIFGLLNGIENAIDSEFESMNFISKERVKIVENILEPYLIGQEEVEMSTKNTLVLSLEKHGINEIEFVDICHYLAAMGNRYDEVIKKIGISDYSLYS